MTYIQYVNPLCYGSLTSLYVKIAYTIICIDHVAKADV